MKKHLILNIAITIIASFNAHGAEYRKKTSYSTAKYDKIIAQGQDTEKYLHDHILAVKEKFIHKELSFMLTELNLTVKSYSLTHGAKFGAPFRYLVLHFEDGETISHKWRKGVNVPELTISFENDIPRKMALSLYVKTFGVWSQAEKDYYGKLIVTDIEGVNPGKN